MTTPTTPSDDLEAAEIEAVARELARHDGHDNVETLITAYSPPGSKGVPAWQFYMLKAERALRLVQPLRRADKAKIAELEGSQHHFRDEDWPLALQRLNHTEPGPDQGIALVGTDDLAFALERLAHFAQVAMGNALAVSTAEARALSAEAALRASQEALGNVEAMLDRYNAPTTDDSDGSLLSLANRIEAKVYADAVAAAKFVADVRIIEPHLDAVICYASDINEHPPNGAVMRIRQTLAQVEGGGEDKGSIPGTRPDDLRASRGEGSGS